ncbi:tRNA lysidine(34) synthetase TilS [bacterium]|nr:tRNA lysidine(34) synthetase TilS [bacterium]
MNQKFLDFMQPWTDRPWALGVSGGADSMAMMHMAARVAARPPVVLHVNHGLRAAAGGDAEFVRAAAEKLGLACHILEWTGPKPTRGIEAAARTARYQLMTDFCGTHGIDTLLIAHQADDQIETFLLNLARGSGVYGLAGMRPVTRRDGVDIVRPLLDMSRADLERYCADNGIDYIHDDMNDDVRYARVRMRARRQVLNTELGISDDRILLAMRNLSRVRGALDDYVARRLENIGDTSRVVVQESFLFDEPREIGLKLLGNLLQRVGGNDYQPRLDSLERALDTLKRGDIQMTLGGCVLRRLRDQILIVPEGHTTSLRKEHEKAKKHSQ